MNEILNLQTTCAVVVERLRLSADTGEVLKAPVRGYKCACVVRKDYNKM
jgi:hypothetical protein